MFYNIFSHYVCTASSIETYSHNEVRSKCLETLKISLMVKSLDKIRTYKFAVYQQSKVVKYYVDIETEAN